MAGWSPKFFTPETAVLLPCCSNAGMKLIRTHLHYIQKWSHGQLSVTLIAHDRDQPFLKDKSRAVKTFILTE